MGEGVGGKNIDRKPGEQALLLGGLGGLPSCCTSSANGDVGGLDLGALTGDAVALGFFSKLKLRRPGRVTGDDLGGAWRILVRVVIGDIISGSVSTTG